MTVFKIKKDWRGKTKVYLFGRKVLSLPTQLTEAGKIYKEFLSGRKVTPFEQKIVLQAMFVENMGYPLNFANPQTYNEKIQWMKLHYHNPLMTLCADKYRVLDYVKEHIGEQYIIPMLGVWDNVDEIDFDALPEQFVLKVNWGCGQNIIVKDKSKLNMYNIKRKLKKWMNPRFNNYYSSFEWAYKDIQPKIICEKYLEQEDGDLRDYKIFCFDGEPHFIQVDTGRYGYHEQGFYDPEWNKLAMQRGYPQAKTVLKKPQCFDDLMRCAKILSSKFPHVRMDFYVLGKQIYFGEFTFSPTAGMGKLTPQSLDKQLGDLINLEACKQSACYVP